MFSCYKNIQQSNIIKETEDDEEVISILNSVVFIQQKNNFPLRNHQQSNAAEINLQRQRKYKRKETKLIELSALPEFQPLKPYKVYFINRMTSLMVIFSLLEQTKRTTKYTMDTEGDYYSNKRTLIQVEFINNHEKESTVLVFEMAHLPEPTTRLFRFTQKLLTAILHPANEILTWDHMKTELLGFIDYNVFSIDLIDSMHATDMQHHFKDWYNRTFPHNQDCIGFHASRDHLSCECNHRPYKNTNDTWGLQMAIAKTYGEFLDKRLRKNTWSIGLDRRLDSAYQPGHLQQQSKQFHWRQQGREKLIQYVVYDCLSVTKLAMAIENNWSCRQLEHYNIHLH